MANSDSTSTNAEPGTGDTRSRISEAAYDLFSHHGTRAVGIESIVERAGVGKMALYRHFGSKDELILEFLRMREQRWTVRWLQEDVTSRAEVPGEQLLAIFDVFDEWFQEDTFEGCSFINVLLEIDDRSSPVRQATVDHLANIRAFLRALAEEVGARDPDDFSRRWHILMKGSIIAAGEGDRLAARRAREIASLLLADESASTGASRDGNHAPARASSPRR